MSVPRKIPAIIKDTIIHSERIKSLFIQPKQKIVRFQPGQFLHLAIDHYDPSYPWPESRVFSIASSPASEIVRITFAVKGKFTKKMYDVLKPEDEVWIKLPYGDFRFEDNKNSSIFIAGGTGITPYMSYLEECLITSKVPDIHLFYGIEKPDHLICGEVLQKNLEKNPNFKLSLYVREKGQDIDLPVRKFDIMNIQNILDDSRKSENFYLSGPIEMIEIFEKKLLNSGVEPSQIHIDRWE